MSNIHRRVLIACYGGGHVQSLLPIAHALSCDPTIELIVLGFTTARSAFKRAGIKALGYDELECYLEKPCPELVGPFLNDVGHPDISPAETHAYFHVGLHDLIIDYGHERAIEMVREKGRVAFMPIHTFSKYLSAASPDLVITSTSPRSELALQRASRILGIPGLAISDLFLQHEKSYLCDGRYAKDITVIADYISQQLINANCNNTHIHVTGNPAFDSLFSEESRNAGTALRSTFNIGNDERLITWFGTAAEVSLRGKTFLSNRDVIDVLEKYCAAHPGSRYAFRPHPNCKESLPENASFGYLLDGEYPVDAVIWASDVVLLEASTVGLQAALIGKPVITIAAENYPPYAELGLAVDIPDLNSLNAALDNMSSPDLSRLAPVGLGDACQRVLQVINQLLEKNSRSVTVQ